MIYWDEQDPENIGWAYKVEGGESGEINNLDDLKYVLENFNHTDPQMEKLPTFGGGDEVAGPEVWSWDEGRVLIGGDVDHLQIINRQE